MLPFGFTVVAILVCSHHPFVISQKTTRSHNNIKVHLSFRPITAHPHSMSSESTSPRPVLLSIASSPFTAIDQDLRQPPRFAFRLQSPPFTGLFRHLRPSGPLCQRYHSLERERGPCGSLRNLPRVPPNPRMLQRLTQQVYYRCSTCFWSKLTINMWCTYFQAILVH